MKPVKLTIKGINSFIDTQTIDFNLLDSRRLFGIFGPTGSGKSTILDGMTLALYGEMARKSTNFVNSNVKTGSVIYEFEIGKKHRKHYRVEREFKRNKDNGINNSLSKIIEITPEGEVVLCDKARSVTEKCIEILGLTCEDFTRTVVLPQGKFSEFLKLEGKPRRDMLERIFALEKYGEQFSSKLSRRYSSVNTQKNRLEGNLLEYENITEEVLCEKGRILSAATEELKNATASLGIIKQEHQHCQQIWSLQQELQGFIKVEEELQQDKPIFDHATGKVEKANKAALIKPYIDDFLNASSSIKEKNGSLLENKREFQLLLVEKEKLDKKYTEITTIKNGKYKDLISIRGKVQDALAKEIELISLDEEIISLRTDYMEQSTKCKAMESKTVEFKQLISDLGTGIASLEIQESETKGSLDKKEQILKGIELLDKNEEAKKKLLSLETSIKEYGADIEKNKILLQQSKNHYEEKKHVIAELTVEKSKLEKHLEDLQEKLKNAERENLAIILRTQLVEGEPCPVCGVIHKGDSLKSLHNSTPTPDITPNIDQLSLLIEEVKKKVCSTEESILKLRDDLSKLEVSMGKFETIMESCEKNIISLKKEYEDITISSSRITTQLSELKESLCIQDFQSSLEHMRKNEILLKNIESELKTNRQKLLTLQSENEKNDNELKKAYACVTEIKTKGSEKSELSKKLHKELDTLKNGRGTLKEYYKELDEEICTIDKSYAQCEQNRNDIVDKLNDISKYIASLESETTMLQHRINSAKDTISKNLVKLDFASMEQAMTCYVSEEEMVKLNNFIKEYEKRKQDIESKISTTKEKLQGETLSQDQWQEICQKLKDTEDNVTELNKSVALYRQDVDNIKSKLMAKSNLLSEMKKTEHTLSILKDLTDLFKGKRFVEYVASQQLKYISRIASRNLSTITNNTYSLETDENSSKFMIIDNKNGNARRDASTLSGGETFLISLSLALALSSQIQLKGTAPLELFFLDEGFGTLDDDLLDVVLESLEKLHSDNLSIGIISHVEKIKERVPVKLLVWPSESGLKGSTVKIVKS
ncbi:exonuclease SbcC [Hathewaya proteolytica DSM 3090]|uniref:Nuclease SbcCD subunit C n=1 Tax=Hathewaya proteolytica DSM 3090 TaxID=1121331 RepID=A0A1M6MT02_9CLOT|nr:SMC family ATPase [Hathewaya proteolytica]SHJ86601.1 exonuclease SbcC [Hathewaya proteolytica DSM 3090]